MSNDLPRPSLDSSKPRTPRDFLSVKIPPPDFPVAVSRFSPESPDSPPLVPNVFQRHQSTSTWTNTTIRAPTPVPMPKPRDIEANSPAPPPSITGRSFRDRFTKLFFDVRMLMKDKDTELVPIQPPELRPWPPLNVDKRAGCQSCQCHFSSHPQKKKRSRRDKLLCIILILVILYLLGNVIFLNVRVASILPTTTPPTSSTSQTLSADAQQCLSEYNVNAPSDPSGYPCSSCLPILQQGPPDFSDGNATDAQQIQNAIQFCGLRAVFDTTNDDGQTALSNDGWVKDVRFCAWTGVTCDGAGRVGSLILKFPAVPAALPNEIGALTGLTSLQVVGDGNIPGGSLPSSFPCLTSMKSLQFESTAIITLPDGLFSSLNQLTTLSLVKNEKMGNNLPSSLTQLSLQNLIVNGQNLNNPLDTLSSSSSIQKSLQVLDLSSSSLSGTIPSSISSLTSLFELHLDSNNLTNPIPASFPPSLASVTLSNNPGLSGSVQGSFCSLEKLQNCDMTETGLTAAGSCSICKFS